MRYALMLAAVLRISAQEFEVATLKASQPDRPDGAVEIGIHIDGAFVRYTSLSLRDYLRNAFQVKEYQISGPDWMKDVKFDLNAKLPEGATRADVPKMLRALLAERLKLTVHRETKEFNIYALVVAKGGARLIESPAQTDGEPATPALNVGVQAGRGGATINFGRGSYFRMEDGKIEMKRVTTTRLLDSLADYLDRPAVDMTGLTGIYDISLEYSLDDLRTLLRTRGVYANIPDTAAAGFPGSIRDSIKKFGLSLEARKGPLEVVVVDRVEKTPAGN